jgi:hypothetical protein
MLRKKDAAKLRVFPLKDPEYQPVDHEERGLWIDPDIWRRIKGEGGRRGVEGLPSTNRYLDYADLTLKSTEKPKPRSTPKRKNKSRS